MHALKRRGGHRGTGGQNAFHRRPLYVVLDAVAPDGAQEGRGGEYVSHPPIVNGVFDFNGINLGRSGEIHVRHNRRHAQSGVEQGEQGKGRQVNFARLNAVGFADQFHLGYKVAVGIDHPFCRAGATAGKEDRCRFLRARVFQKWAGTLTQRCHFCERRPAPAPAGADGNEMADGMSSPAQ